METNKYVFFAALIWALSWKAIALWRAARENRPGWFTAIFLIQSLGLLEITYIFLFSGKEKSNE